MKCSIYLCSLSKNLTQNWLRPSWQGQNYLWSCTFTLLEKQKVHHASRLIDPADDPLTIPPLSPSTILLSLTPTTSPLFTLIMTDILNTVEGIVKLLYCERHTKENLIEAVIQRAPSHVLISLTMMALDDCSCHSKRPCISTIGDVLIWRVCQRIEGIEHDVAKFMMLLTKEERYWCYREFYKATSNQAVALATCTVYRQEYSMLDDRVEQLLLQDIPNSWWLHPYLDNIHPAQYLIDGMLLERNGLVHSQDMSIIAIKICRQCKSTLEALDRTIPPKFSLANNLWIGEIPWELHILTAPE